MGSTWPTTGHPPRGSVGASPAWSCVRNKGVTVITLTQGGVFERHMTELADLAQSPGARTFSLVVLNTRASVPPPLIPDSVGDEG